jgi:hypothetical protein
VNTDIETRLREQATTIVMHRSFEEVVDRGDRLRRRRTGRVAGAGAAAAVAVLAGSIALPPGSSPVVAPAVAAWSGGPTNLTPTELASVSDACLAGQDSIPTGTMPIAAQSRGATVLAYFRSDEAQATCVAAEQPSGDLRLERRLEQDATPLPPGTDVGGEIRFGYADPGVEGGPVTGPWTAGQVSSRVDRVTARIGGQTFEGTVADGVALFWLTGTFDRRQVEEAVFTAYDADSDVLARVAPRSSSGDRGN